MASGESVSLKIYKGDLRHVASFLKVMGGGQTHPKNLENRDKQKQKLPKVFKILIRGGLGGMLRAWASNFPID